MIDTKAAPRRDLSYSSLADLRADLDAAESAAAAGTLGASGNWSPGQILQHVAKMFGFAMDGFPGRPPWPIRVAGRLVFRRRFLGSGTFSPGLPLPKEAAFLLPDDGVTFERGLAALRDRLDRIDRGERMTHPSPIFGPLTHDQWVTIQLKHAALHMSFLRF